jgi:hypothetical protein
MMVVWMVDLMVLRSVEMLAALLVECWVALMAGSRVDQRVVNLADLKAGHWAAMMADLMVLRSVDLKADLMVDLMVVLMVGV